MNESRGSYCYGTNSDPHTPVRTVYLNEERVFRCLLCGREPDPNDAEDIALEMNENAVEDLSMSNMG
jgi:hypothetical protein